MSYLPLPILVYPLAQARAPSSSPWSSCAPRGPTRASSSSAPGHNVGVVWGCGGGQRLLIRHKSGHHSGSPHDCSSSTHLCIVGTPGPHLCASLAPPSRTPARMLWIGGNEEESPGEKTRRASARTFFLDYRSKLRRY
ncbi:hypothetical protein DFH06DRAFT_448765 [Mycena polygramma]|nr:hypothetical protein DFH06DRAFT_448765 [Mycena polygramma]